MLVAAAFQGNLAPEHAINNEEVSAGKKYSDHPPSQPHKQSIGP